MMEKFDSHGEDIVSELFLPSESGKQPAIVVAHGTAGMDEQFGPAIRSFANDLAAKGYVVLIPLYFGQTKAGVDALNAFPGRCDTWVETLGDALSYAAGRDDVKAEVIGLLGFSMGGHLALRRAKITSGVKVEALVEFFAPIKRPWPFNGIGEDIDKLPPTQIHHGTDDRIVDPEESEELRRLLLAVGKKENVDFEIHRYKDEGHGFKGALAVSDSKKRTLNFFDKYLR